MFLKKCTFCILNLEFLTKAIAVALVAALVITMPGMTGWADTGASNNSNTTPTIVSPGVSAADIINGGPHVVAIGKPEDIPPFEQQGINNQGRVSTQDMNAALLTQVPLTAQLENIVHGVSASAEALMTLAGFNKRVTYQYAGDNSSSAIQVNPRTPDISLNPQNNPIAMQELQGIRASIIGVNYPNGPAPSAGNPGSVGMPTEIVPPQGIPPVEDSSDENGPDESGADFMQYTYTTRRQGSGAMHAQFTPGDNSATAIQNMIEGEMELQAKDFMDNGVDVYKTYVDKDFQMAEWADKLKASLDNLRAQLNKFQQKMQDESHTPTAAPNGGSNADNGVTAANFEDQQNLAEMKKAMDQLQHAYRLALDNRQTYDSEVLLIGPILRQQISQMSVEERYYINEIGGNVNFNNLSQTYVDRENQYLATMNPPK